jgi:hypothetical protein
MKRIVVFDLVLIAVCSVAAIFVGTDLGGWWFPIVMGIIILWAFISLVVKLADRSPVVIRLGHYEWTLREACRHFLLIGGTGSGKTEGGMVNILIQLVQNVPGLGGIALDAKGDFRHVLFLFLKATDAKMMSLSLKPGPCKAARTGSRAIG